MDPTLVLGGMKLLGGLFGNKKADPTPADNLMSQAQGARDAAAKYGFNPLTMLQYGQTGGAMGGGGAPPLASTELLMGGLADIGDVLSGEKAQRVAANKLQTDLAQIKLDQLRASAATKVGAGASPLGRRAAQVVDPSTGFKFSGGGSLSSGGSVTADPVILRAGVDGGIAPPEPRLDRGSGVFAFGRYISPSQKFSPSNVWENEYGDIAQAFVGLGKLGADLVSSPDSTQTAPKRPSTDVLDPERKLPENQGPWRKAFSRFSWPAGSPSFSKF